MWKMDYDQISRNYWDSVSILCRCCKSMNVCLDMSWYSLAFLINRIRWFWKFYCQMISKLSIYSSSLWVYFRQVKYLINKSTTIFVFPLNLKKKILWSLCFFLYLDWVNCLQIFGFFRDSLQTNCNPLKLLIRLISMKSEIIRLSFLYELFKDSFKLI